MPEPRSTARRSTRAALTLAIMALPALTAITAAPASAAWRSIGPDGGRVTALVALPNPAGTLFAGTEAGSVLRSRDAGATWQRVGVFRTERVVALAHSLAAPGTVWAGTPSGLFRTTDGGDTWAPIGPAGAHIGALAAAPSDPDVLYAVMRQSTPLGQTSRVEASADGGATWAPVVNLPDGVLELAVEPADPRTVYAGTSQGVWVTRNGGRRWRRPSQLFRVESLLADPTNPGTLWAGGHVNAPGTGVWKSADRGASWVAVGFGLPLFADVTALAVDPTAPAAYAGLTGTGLSAVATSRDGGITWSLAPLDGPSGGREWVDALAVDPGRPGRAWAGTRLAGVMATADAGTSWRGANRGLSALTIADLDVHPISGALYAAAEIFLQETVSVFGSADDGASWTPLRRAPFIPRVFEVLLDPEVPGRLLAGTERGLFETIDDGATWRRLDDPALPAEIRDLARAPSDPRVVYAVGVTGRCDFGRCPIPFTPLALKSVDGGRTWAEIATPTSGLDRLTVDRSDPDVVISAGSRTLDGGASWRQLPVGSSDIVTALMADPATGALWAAQRRRTVPGPRVWTSRDRGITWQPAAVGLPPKADVFDLAVDAARPGVLLAGTSRGAWISTDGGATWRNLGLAGLPALEVTAVAFGPPGSGQVYAGTRGGSVAVLDNQ